MIRRHIAALHIALMIADATIAIALFMGLSIVRFGPGGWESTWQSAGIDGRLAAVLYGLALVAVLWVQGLYRLRVRLSTRREMVDVLTAIVLLAVVVFTALFLFKLPNVSRLFLLLLFPVQAAATITIRAFIRWTFLRLRSRGYNTRYFLIVGANPAAERFADAIERHRELGLQAVGHLAGPNDRTRGTDRLVRRPILGDLDDIGTVMHGSVVDEVIVCLERDDRQMTEAITRLCEDEGRVVRIPLTDLGPVIPGGRIEEFNGIEVQSLAYGPDRTIGMIAKRSIDVVLAVLGLVILSPVLLVVALVVRLREGGPVLFWQTRVGVHGRPFQVVKFRTMVPGAEALLDDLEADNEISGPAFKLTDDPRLTGTGRWLRSTSIDELPQLWNVLRAEMSLVGPRPPLPREVEAYDVWHRRRLSMQPGITGLWQVAARRDPDFDRWVRLDLDYIDRWSLWLDLKIIARTIPAVLSGEGR